MDAWTKAGAAGFGLGSALYSPGDRAETVAARAQRFVAQWNALSRA
jgi:2-dehydro-3-deoxyphosphogalactonate aldolase